MSRGSIWTTLGVSRKADKAEIRRAYAAKLKVTNPEDDPEGFKALRAAYEQALAQVGGRGAGSFAVLDTGAPFEAEIEQSGEETPPPPRSRSRPDREEPLVDSGSEPAVAWQEPVPSEAQKARAAFEAACARLSGLVGRDPPPSADALRLALDDVIGSGQLDDVGLYTRVESWLADLIAYNSPASDPLVAVAVARFGWRARGESIHTSHAIHHIVARERDLVFIQRLKAPGSSFHQAYKNLSQPPRSGPFAKLKALWQAAEVRQLLDYADGDYPTLYQDFDPSAVRWWREYLNKPRVSLTALLVLYGAPLLLALFYAVAGPAGTRVLGAFGGYAVWAVLVSAPMMFWLFVFLPLRRKWDTEWSDQAGPWRRLGWAIAGPVLLLMASVAPAHPLVLGAMTTVSLAVLLWMYLVRPPQPGQTLTDQAVHFAWFNLFALICWAIMVAGVEAAKGWQMAIPLLACAVIYTHGLHGLDDVWNHDLSVGQRLAVLYGAGAALVIAFAFCVLAPDRTSLAHAAAAFAVILSMTLRAPGLRFVQDIGQGRTGLVIGMAVVATMIGAGLQGGRLALTSLVLLASAALTIVVAIRAELHAERRRKTRDKRLF